MAEQDPVREIAGMVEKSMGAGGAPMTIEEQLAVSIQDDVDELPEGVELDTGEEEVPLGAEPYKHDANLAEVFGSSEPINMFEMTKRVSKHLKNTD